MGFNYEIGRIESSIKCLKGQLELIRNENIYNQASIPIIEDTVKGLEKEIESLKKGLEEKKLYYKVRICD